MNMFDVIWDSHRLYVPSVEQWYSLD